MLRILCVGLTVGALASAQAMTEMSAAAAGGLVGGAAGKPISDGVASIFGKVDQLTKEAAGDKGNDKEKGKEKGNRGKSNGGGVMQVGPSYDAGGVPRAYSVPDPPPARTTVARRVTAPQVVAEPPTLATEPLAPLAPPEPAVTLASLEPGMDREMVSKVQTPAIRITSYEDGHLVEVYRYADGVVRLSDGAVEKITRY